MVWSRNGGTSSGALQLFQDGHWVAKADDTTRLRQLVATSPLAVEFVDAAESAQSAGSTKLYIGIGLLLLSLVSEGVAVVGAVQKDYLVAAGGLGGGIVLLSVGLPIASSGMTSEGVATTNAMNAVDAYNEQLRRRNDFFGE